MRRTILFTLLALTLSSGAALAAPHRGGDNRRDDHRADHRADRRADDYRGGVAIRNPRDPIWTERNRRVVHRAPVHASNGYYQFQNGYRYRYARPVIQRRYFDYRVRPQIIFESYQPVTGYVWIPGQWQWNGYEWTWTSGYYAADPGYDASYDASYDDGIRY